MQNTVRLAPGVCGPQLDISLTIANGAILFRHLHLALYKYCPICFNYTALVQATLSLFIRHFLLENLFSPLPPLEKFNAICKPSWSSLHRRPTPFLDYLLTSYSFQVPALNHTNPLSHFLYSLYMLALPTHICYKNKILMNSCLLYLQTYYHVLNLSLIIAHNTHTTILCCPIHN